MTNQIAVDRGNSSDEEIDFMLPKQQLLIESKYSNKIDLRDYRYLKLRSAESKLKKLILSRKTFLEQDGFSVVPVWLL